MARWLTLLGVVLAATSVVPCDDKDDDDDADTGDYFAGSGDGGGYGSGGGGSSGTAGDSPDRHLYLFQSASAATSGPDIEVPAAEK